MTCDDAKPLLAAFSDGSLSDLDRAAVVGHLGRCAPCRRLVQRRERLTGLLTAALPDPAPDAAHLERQRARILAAAATRPSPFRRRWVWAAAAALAVAALLPFLFRKTEPAPTPAPPVAEHPAPRPEPSPEPVRPAPTPAPVPPRIPETPSSPRPEPVPPVEPPAPAVVARGPAAGTADRTLRMSDEAVEVAVAETPAERVAALCAAAEAQLRELADVLTKDPVLAGELAGAYRILVSEGVAEVLVDPAEPAEERALARDLAVRRAREHASALAKLRGGARGPLQDQLALALEASQSLAGR